MTMRVVDLHDLEPGAWDAFVGHHPQGHIYHQEAWARIIPQAYGLRPAYLAALEDGRVAGVLPLMACRTLSGGRKLVSLPFCDFAGVLAAGDQARDALLEAAQALAGRGKAKLEIRHQERPGMDWPAFAGHLTQVIDLEPGLDKLFAALSSNLRRKVRKAQKNGLDSRVGGVEIVPHFHGVYCDNLRRLGTPNHSLAFLRAVMEHLPREARVLLVSLEGRPVAGMFLLRYKHALRMCWAASLKEFNSFYVNNFMYWAAVEHACADGATLFDLGRSRPGGGVYEFKSQWNSQDRRLYYHVWPGPAPATPYGPQAERLARAWSRLPLAITRPLGARLRKFIP